jgi:hypothetical protein
MISLTTLRKEFECQICLDNCMRRNRVVLGDCPAGDAHAMCTPCATTYLTGRVEEGRVLQGLRCPNHGQDGCAARASPDQLKRLLSDETFAKYERFLAQREDPTMRECPVCAERVRPKRKRSDGADPGASAGGGPPPAAGEIVAAMRCSRGHEFCYYHSNAHAGDETCEEYAKRMARETRAAASALGDVKACPACGVMTHKSSGCNHMTCPACKGNWCWTCGKTLGAGKAAVGWHFNPANPVGCLQQEYTMDVDTLRGPMTCFVRLLSAPGIALGFVLFFGFVPAWPLCGLGFLASILAIMLVQIVWVVPVSLVVVPVISLLGATSGHAEMFMMAPMATWIACAECAGFINEDADGMVERWGDASKSGESKSGDGAGGEVDAGRLSEKERIALAIQRSLEEGGAPGPEGAAAGADESV